MLTYETLLDKALSELSEFKKEYEKMIEEGLIDRGAGNHIVFSYAFVPVLINAIKNDDTETITSMLGFVEQMAGSEDDLVGEVCDFTILEELNDEIEDDVIIKLIGPETKKDFALLKNYMK